MYHLSLLAVFSFSAPFISTSSSTIVTDEAFESSLIMLAVLEFPLEVEFTTEPTMVLFLLATTEDVPVPVEIVLVLVPLAGVGLVPPELCDDGISET